MATTPQALTPEQIQQIIAAGRGNTVNIGGTLYGANYADIGDGESRQEGALAGITGSTGIDAAGQPYYSYDPSGAYTGQGLTKKSQSFFGGLVDAFKDPVVLAALGGAAGAGLFGAGAAGGAAGLTAAEAAGLGLTAAEASALGLSASEFAAAAGTAGAAGASGLTASQIANLAKAGINVAGLVAGGNAISNMGNNGTASTGVSIPTQGMPQYSQDYYSQLQNTYNQIMPGVPRDVVSNLASWYGSGGNSTGMMSGGTTTPTTTVMPKVTTPVTNTTPVNLGSTAYQYATNQGGLTPMQYLNNINQWVIDNPNASVADINAIKTKLGVSDVDVQTALGQSTFSDATKYALTHGMGLSDVNTNIVNWLAKNPQATNAQIQAEQTKYSVSDADVARALTEQNSSAAKEYAVINDMGLDQYYKNIASVAQSGISPADAAAQMRQYGVSPADVQAAYSMFAPKAGLTLDDVLAAYKG